MLMMVKKIQEYGLGNFDLVATYVGKKVQPEGNLCNYFSQNNWSTCVSTWDIPYT